MIVVNYVCKPEPGVTENGTFAIDDGSVVAVFDSGALKITGLIGQSRVFSNISEFTVRNVALVVDRPEGFEL